MCDLFHALDILASTSSIWNLCVISLDRYMAGQDPIGYRDKVSKRRILMAICGVWMMSACLSFPAIIWWRTTSPHLYMAGQDPIGYRDKVSKRRILMAICGVWMMSACLSFPAIIWWRTTSPHLYEHKVKKLFAEFRILIVMSEKSFRC
ncbi:hypothetical protein COOONC_07836 [Cooperia oncophora]